MTQYHPKQEMKRHVRAFLYLATGLGKEKDVMEELWKLPEVKEVHIITGKYDILAVVEVGRELLEPESQSVYWFILDMIKHIGAISDTETTIPIVSCSKWSN